MECFRVAVSAYPTENIVDTFFLLRFTGTSYLSAPPVPVCQALLLSSKLQTVHFMPALPSAMFAAFLHP